LAQDYVIHPFLPESLHAPGFVPTQLFSIWLVLYVGALFFYFAFASMSYYYFFRLRRDLYYPDTLPNSLTDQIQTEIGISMRSFPFMAILMMPFAFGVSKGWSKIYYSVDDYGWGYLFLSIPFFLFVTDFMIYFIHRGLHIPILYKYIHKPHHTYRYTTPFSSHAFHPVDGWAQGVPYYIFAYIFPFHHILWVVMFVFINFWTISIHDQVDFSSHFSWINSTGHHTIHHAEFNYNYGQYFTLWDRIMHTHKDSIRTHNFWAGKRLAQPNQVSNTKRKDVKSK